MAEDPRRTPPAGTPPATGGSFEVSARLRRLNLALLVGACAGLVIVAAAVLLGWVAEMSRGVLLAVVFALIALRSALRLRTLRRDETA